MSDFNEITEASKKYGMVRQPQWQMESFSNTLEACHLFDLGFSGPKFTGCNRWEGFGFVKERLDRVSATHEWCDMNPRFWVEVLAARSLDHAPLAFSVCTKQQIFRGRRVGSGMRLGGFKNQQA